MIIVVCSLKSMCIPSFVLIVYCVSELHGHLSSHHNYGLRLFIVVLQELHCLLLIVVCLLKSRCIPSFVLIVCCVNELLGHLGPYRDVWPEAVYCCITRTTLFTTYLEVAITSPDFVALLLPVSQIAKYIA